MNQRIIKFRAWDNQNKCFLSPDDVNICASGYKQVFDRGSEEFMSANSGEIILMQYTGLKDKEGVEIYDGDIVKQQPILVDEEKVGEVTISPTQGVRIGAYTYFTTPCEVIGNIYENPEILVED